jgi:hypothetical protein
VAPAGAMSIGQMFQNNAPLSMSGYMGEVINGREAMKFNFNIDETFGRDLLESLT